MKTKNKSCSGYPTPSPLDISQQQFCDPRAEEVMEQLRKIAAGKFGVTVTGPYVTLRFYDKEHLVQVSMQVTEITHNGILTEREYNGDK